MLRQALFLYAAAVAAQGVLENRPVPISNDAPNPYAELLAGLHNRLPTRAELRHSFNTGALLSGWGHAVEDVSSSTQVPNDVMQNIHVILPGMSDAEAQARYDEYMAEENAQEEINAEKVDRFTKEKDGSKLGEDAGNELLFHKRMPEPLSRFYINHTDKLYSNLLSVTPIDGFEDFAVHGMPGSSFVIYETTNGVLTQYNAADFAEILKSDPEYHGGNIRLLSCGAGSKQSHFASELALAMDIKILAPTETLWIADHGELFISDSDVLAELWYNGGNINYDIKSTGKWKIFP